MRKQTKGVAPSSLRIITFILPEVFSHEHGLCFRDPLQGREMGGEGVIATNMSARITVQVQVTTLVAVQADDDRFKGAARTLGSHPGHSVRSLP